MFNFHFFNFDTFFWCQWTFFFHCFKVAILCSMHDTKYRTVHIFCSLCMEFGLLTLISDTDKVLKKIWRSRTSLLMNKILVSGNALTKLYLLGSIEFLATLKCLIIICFFLPAEFWQKCAEVSELTGHGRTSGNYGTTRLFSFCFVSGGQLQGDRHQREYRHSHCPREESSLRIPVPPRGNHSHSRYYPVFTQ